LEQASSRAPRPATGFDAMAEKDLTRGPVLKALLALALPITASNLLSTVYQLTDAFWVGRLGADAIAAVATSFPVLFLVSSLGFGLAIAGRILASHHWGAGNRSSVNHVATQTLMAMIAASLVITVVGLASADQLIGLLGVTPEVFASATAYLKTFFLGTPFIFAYFALQSVMQGIGDARTPMYIMLTTVLLNFALDPLFIFGFGPIPALGVAGAAMATVFTEFVAAALAIFLLFSGKHAIQLTPLKPDYALTRKLFSLGLPASFEQGLRATSMFLLTWLAASFGTGVLAAYGLSGRIFSFIIIPAMGISLAASTLAGQTYGAKKFRRLKSVARQSVAVSFAFMALSAAALYVFSTPITQAFLPGEPEVTLLATEFLQMIAFALPFIGIEVSLLGLVRGTGNTRAPLVLTLATLVLQVFAAYALSTFLGYKGIWWAYLVGNVVASAVTLAWFRSTQTLFKT